MVVNLSAVYLLIKQNKSGVSPTLKKKNKYNQIVIHLLIVIFINICCWIPSAVVSILLLIRYKMSGYLFVWIIIVVVPINSFTNPLLFSILTPNTKRVFSSVLC